MISDMHHPFDDRIYWKQSLSLIDNGCQVTHICVGSSNKTYISQDGIKIIQIERKKYLQNVVLNKAYKAMLNLDVFNEILRVAKEENADLYICHDFKLIKTALKLKKNGYKVVYDAHDPFYQNLIDYRSNSNVLTKWIYQLYSKRIQRNEKRIIPILDGVITTEKNLEDYYIKKNAKRTKVIYNYTDLNKRNENPGFDQRGIDLFYCGQISKFRGIFQIIELVKLLVEKKRDLKVLLLGKMADELTERIVHKRIKEYSLEKNIEIKASVPYEEVSKYYLQSKIGLALFLPIPTHKIILPIKIFEYFVHGLPIVGSDFGHIHSYIQEYDGGISVNPESIETAINPILEILENENLFETISKKNMKSANMFRWDIMEKEFIAFIKSIIT